MSITRGAVGEIAHDQSARLQFTHRPIEQRRLVERNRLPQSTVDTPDPTTGMLAAEYVDVYGIPFSLIPYKGKTETESKPDPVYHSVFAVPERR